MKVVWALGIALAINLIVATSAEEKLIVKQKDETLELTCEGEDSIQWTVNGQPRPQTTFSGSANLVKSKLVEANITAADAGTYKCMQADGTDIDTFEVMVLAIDGQNRSLVENSTVTELMCSVGDSGVIITNLRWMMGGQLLNNTEKYTVSTDSNFSSTSLLISKPVEEDAGLYVCVVTVSIDDKVKDFYRSFSLNTAATVQPIVKLRSKVEGEIAKIECNVSGFPVPDITWYRKLEEETVLTEIKYDDRVNTTENADKVPNSILIIRDLKINKDRGDYTCVARNSLGDANYTATLKVKDKLAAVWPFLGICAEVAILCSIIFIFEKRRNRRMEEEEEVDAVKQDLMNQSNGTEDKELRQRSNATTKA